MNIQLLLDVLGGSVSSYLLSKPPHRLKIARVEDGVFTAC